MSADRETLLGGEHGSYSPVTEEMMATVGTEFGWMAQAVLCRAAEGGLISVRDLLLISVKILTRVLPVGEGQRESEVINLKKWHSERAVEAASIMLHHLEMEGLCEYGGYDEQGELGECRLPANDRIFVASDEVVRAAHDGTRLEVSVLAAGDKPIRAKHVCTLVQRSDSGGWYRSPILSKDEKDGLANV